MKLPRILKALAVAILALALGIPAYAGGWATITLDQWPQNVMAGDSLTIGFTVRQHGQDEARMTNLTPTVTLQDPVNGETTILDAAAQGPAGHYQAEWTFPNPGVWDWSIQAFTMDQPMPGLTVLPAAQKPAPENAGQSNTFQLAGGLGLALAIAAGVSALRKRTRWALALVIAALAAGSVGLASAAPRSPNHVSPVSGSALPPAELGEKLFIVKGCLNCHQHARIDSSFRSFTTDLGPVLTQYSASPELLRIWLKDPSAVKPQTQMPNLELTADEIEALTAFLSSRP